MLTTLFHAAQSFFVIVNEGITLEQQAWLMAGVYLGVALLVGSLAGRNLRQPSGDKRTINHPLHPWVDDTSPG